ncbi:MAG: RsmD family RNA methyltransferase [Phycisphaerae bacterium]|nr:RsmD family RNA methyltransferase [Phycisphaerae bacterium]
MRIVGGQWRRKTLVSPPGENTRPMPERVREAVLEKVGSQWGTPGGLPEVRVLDLFAGSGASGLEALSRGAAWCCFVDQAGVALKALRQNVKSVLGDEAGGLAQIVQGDAFRPKSYIRMLAHDSIDLVFVDPPYAASRDNAASGPVARLLEGLCQGPLLAEDALIVLRHESRVDYDETPYGSLEVVDVRRYGGMKVTYLTNGHA